MTATHSTDLKQQIAAHRRTLAEATKECPRQWYFDGEPIPQDGPGCDHPDECECRATGLVARFPGFRQKCALQIVNWDGKIEHAADCWVCNSTGWQVAPGGLEDGLAGLDNDVEGLKFLGRLELWLLARSAGPMPSAPEILAKGLELVIEKAGLEVSGE